MAACRAKSADLILTLALGRLAHHGAEVVEASRAGSRDILAICCLPLQRRAEQAQFRHLLDDLALRGSVCLQARQLTGETVHPLS